MRDARLVKGAWPGLSRLDAVELFLVPGGQKVVEGCKQAARVEPRHPLEGRVLHVVEPPPGAHVADYLDLVQADGGLGECVIVGIAPAADRRLDPGFCQPLRVAN